MFSHRADELAGVRAEHRPGLDQLRRNRKAKARSQSRMQWKRKVKVESQAGQHREDRKERRGLSHGRSGHAGHKGAPPPRRHRRPRCRPAACI